MNLSRHALPATLTVVAAIALSLTAPLAAQVPVHVPDAAPARIHPLPPLRQQAEEIREWNRIRLETVLPGLMREYGVDMWVLSMREYAEDPVFWSFKDPTTFAARRRSIYVFYDQGPDEGVERLALGGSSQGGLFRAFQSTRPADPGASGRSAGELVGNEQWQLFRELVED
ncbi:MAG: Xaa-Pro aminopeptidase, partial [Longimicrobiales bacterium]